MLKKLRIRTEIGVDKEVTFDLNQDFDLLEILSLNLHQTDVYPKDCSEFGVVCGRVLINGGFGLPNAKISIFIPLDETDEQNPQVKELYPYKTQTLEMRWVIHLFGVDLNLKSLVNQNLDLNQR